MINLSNDDYTEEDILVAKNLCKSYSRKIVLDNFNLIIPKGRILGLLGPNGSGKTTFLKIICGLLPDFKGDILINAKRPSPYTNSIISYLPDKNFLFNWMKVRDALNFYKDFYKDFNEKKAKELLKFMDLDENLRITALSKGMIEKLNLSLILSRNAKLYILDEPIGGVDTTTREKILDAILQNYSKESSMIITTHLINELERIFDYVAFMKDGKIILEDNTEELRCKYNKSIDEIYRDIFK